MNGNCIEKMAIEEKSLKTLKKTDNWNRSLTAVVKWTDIFKHDVHLNSLRLLL